MPFQNRNPSLRSVVKTYKNCVRQQNVTQNIYGPALKTQTVNTEDEFASETALGNFLDDVALVADIMEGVDEGSGEARFVVYLMTIHGSKSMEFDAVFVVGNEEGQIQAEGNDRTTNPRTPLTRSVANERPKPIPKNGARTKSPTTTSGSKAQTKESAQMDSTWFFPVGSDVVHEKFGDGKVLEPPEGGGSNALPVLVKFQDGTEQEFCARGSDIVPDFGL